jgi:hypothetical protein
MTRLVTFQRKTFSRIPRQKWTKMEHTVAQRQQTKKRRASQPSQPAKKSSQKRRGRSRRTRPQSNEEDN